MNEKEISVQKDFHRGEKVKILYLDLEISPMVALTFSAYEANAFQVKKPPIIIAFAYQWEGEKTIHGKILPDYEGYKAGLFNLDDKLLVTELYEVMEKANLIVGHNLKKFDIKHAKTRFYTHGLPPPRKWLIEDTLLIARKYFAFPKNNLDYLSEYDGETGKTREKYSDLIGGCIDGNLRDWQKMRLYNKRDIEITRNRYLKFRGWHETHTNLNFITRKNDCPVCGSGDIQCRGYAKSFKKTAVAQRYSCNNCGKWWTGEYIARVRDETLEPVIQSNP